jgi:hypothetical protein
MPYKAKSACSVPGCAVLSDGGRCEEHSKQAKREEVKRNYGRAPYRNTARWKRLRLWFFKRNWQCQRILPNGEQCPYLARILHHIVSPEADESLTYEVTNLLGVCEEHHPNTSGEQDTSRYVPTVTED